MDVDREGSAGQHVPEDPPSHRLRQATLTKTFRDLGVIPEIADALETEGIVTPFPIQEMALPLALSGQDIIGQARTGTGKTYAFGIPTHQLIGKPRKNRKKPRGLILAPTRELALQVTEDLVLAAGKLGTRITTVYGGRAYEPQIEALKNGVDVVVGTPGRLLDLVAADIAESDRPQIVDNMVLVYAWNEWHEGGIIEPNARDGCLYLDIIRDRLSLHGGTGCVANPEPVA